MIDIKAEAGKIGAETYHSAEIITVESIIDLCTRVRAEALEDAAKICDANRLLTCPLTHANIREHERWIKPM